MSRCPHISRLLSGVTLIARTDPPELTFGAKRKNTRGSANGMSRLHKLTSWRDRRPLVLKPISPYDLPMPLPSQVPTRRGDRRITGLMLSFDDAHEADRPITMWAELLQAEHREGRGDQYDHPGTVGAFNTSDRGLCTLAFASADAGAGQDQQTGLGFTSGHSHGPLHPSKGLLCQSGIAQRPCLIGATGGTAAMASQPPPWRAAVEHTGCRNR